MSSGSLKNVTPKIYVYKSYLIYVLIEFGIK